MHRPLELQAGNQSSEVFRRLSRYYGILDGHLPARYRVAKRLTAEVDPSLSLSELWNVHEGLRLPFLDLLKKVDLGDVSLDEMRVPHFSYLDLKVEIADRIARSCHLCHRRCSADRSKRERGFCRLGVNAHVSSAFLHMGEEPPLIPSGTVFFSSCTFGCVFCQNYDISTNPDVGTEVSPSELASIFSSLSRAGAANINLVGGEPTPNIPSILKAFVYLDVDVPILWNSNMYCSAESMDLILDLMDFWLPDLKYGNDRCALRLSGIPDYFDVVSRNHKIAHDRGSGEMIIRHLILPNHLDCCTMPALEWIAENCPKALVNIMQQYRPSHLVPGNPKYAEIDRYLAGEEIRKAYDKADELGIVWKPLS